MSTTAATCASMGGTPVDEAVFRTAELPHSGERALQALASEFDSLYGVVYRYLLHRVFDPELAEEMTARTFYNAAVSLKRPRAEVKQIRLWLLRAATNVANTRYRRNRLRRFVLQQLGRVRLTTAENPSAADSSTGQRLARVRGALSALHPKYQTVVVLRYYCQMSYADIAKITGCREDAVRTRLSRAVKEMRQRLAGGATRDSSNS